MQQLSRFFIVSITGLLGLLVSTAYSAGYRIEFQSASTLADGGGAAVAEDASTNWYNPAGLIGLPRQLVVSGVYMYAPSRFSGQMSVPLDPNNPASPTIFQASGKASSYFNGLLPSIHASLPYNEHIAFGLSINPAWGLAADYGENSVVRYALTRVYSRTLNVGPSLAWKYNNQLSFGIGPDAHFFSVQSKAHVFTGLPLDSTSRFAADSWNYGFHAGALYRISAATRIGLNYRSKLNMKLTGRSAFNDPNGVLGFSETTNFRLPITLPASTTLSVYHAISPEIALLGSAAYDQWSVLNHYHAHNFAAPIIGSLPDVILVQDMHDTLDLAAGAHIKMNDQLMLRTAFRYIPSPTRDAHRDLTFPDPTKYVVDLGTRYRINKKIALDLMYAHVFTPTVRINDFNPITGSLAHGHLHTNVDVIAAQVVWDC